MYDKEYVKKLAAWLNIELDDQLAERILNDINKLSQDGGFKALEHIGNVQYQKRANCSSFKKDEPINAQDDVLNNCKKADKFVVGK